MLRWIGPLCVFAVVYGTYNLWSHRSVARAAGVIAPREPVQRGMVTTPGPLSRGGMKLNPVAEFAVEARVLSTAHYHWDALGSVSPIDLALGWGRMSDSSVLAELSISQNTRFFSYRYQEPPIPPDEIVRSASNMHMIPASDEIEKRLNAVRKGEVVQFKGYLVNVSKPDGSEWRSSTTRDDTGPGACEIVYVTEFNKSSR